MTRIFALIIIVIAAVTVGSPLVAQTGTTFTYQGSLKENGGVANGVFNLDFTLWDALAGGSQIGSEVMFNAQPVVDGRFTVELDFGASAFDNSSRWLEITVNGTELSPRQPITRAPYSIQTRGIFVDENNNVGIGTTIPEANMHIVGGQGALQLDGDAADSFSEFKDASQEQLRINKTNNAGSVILDINPKADDGTSVALVRFFRETNTTGLKAAQFLRGNFTTEPSARIGVDGENSFFGVHGGHVHRVLDRSHCQKIDQ